MQLRAVLTLLFAATLFAREHNDVLVMRNGDRITGEIKGLESGVLRIDVAYVDGALSIEWSKISRIESPQLFIVKTEDGSVYTGALGSDSGPESERPLLVRRSDGADPVAIQKAHVVGLEETSRKFFQAVSGSVLLGVVYSKGNNATQYNLGSGAEYRRERWGFGASFNSNLSANSGSNTATHNQFDFDVYRLMNRKNYFYSAFGNFLQSSVQGIDLQTTLGAGIGHYFKNTNQVRFSVVGGLLWQSAKYQPDVVPIATQHIVGGAIVTDLSVSFFKKTNLNARTTLAPAFSDPGRVHVNTNVSYYVKILGDLSWDFSFYGNWDTNPPGNFAGADFGYSSGMRWTFGYK